MQKRETYTINEDLVEELTIFCEQTGTTKSGVVETAVRQYIDAQKKLPTLINQLKELTDAVNELVKKKK